MITVIIYLRKTGQLQELFEKEKAPRYSAGQPDIIESESANNQTPQPKGDLDDSTPRE